tara:strand:- start:997 stop:1272 length:276 start_codon:yes stop_codon:yes gene_type:complete
MKPIKHHSYSLVCPLKLSSYVDEPQHVIFYALDVIIYAHYWALSQADSSEKRRKTQKKLQKDIKTPKRRKKGKKMPLDTTAAIYRQHCLPA